MDSKMRAILIDRCCRGEVDEVRKLLSEDNTSFDIDFRDDTQDGNTLLHWSADAGHVAVCQLLLDHHASVNIQNSEGNTPLHMAAWNGHSECVATLLTHNARSTFRNFRGLTAVDMCRDPKIAELILLGGADYENEEYSVTDDDLADDFDEEIADDLDLENGDESD